MTRQMHQRMAMINAKRVKCCRNEAQKKLARRQCIEHLRASLTEVDRG